MTNSTRPSTASDAQSDTPVETDTPVAADGGSGEDGGPVVILHVEPDARSAELLTTFAERFADGFAVRSVDGMEAALGAVDAADCVVTEQRLPDGSGVDLVDRIRGRGIDVPVVFHTTCRERETEARTLAAGADAYFPKRPERGQYDRILERLGGLVGDGSRASRTATTVSPDRPSSSVKASQSEE
ncbi:response regulator [Halorubrum salipaludis]|uniref:Response regulator n=1 Tax=Halorubrum salipaludis TaxID=2032630 RepID=A0A2A2FE39_9EURY|nr:response regulator [Halorubrum salipaludis]PAU82937.1 response regulator [Halorubrum salipaludis]